MSSTFQYDWLTSSCSWDSQRECSSKSRRYSWFDSNRDCRISCVVIGIHSLQGCRSVHISVTIITIGLWMPRGKKRGGGQFPIGALTVQVTDALGLLFVVNLRYRAEQDARRQSDACLPDDIERVHAAGSSVVIFVVKPPLRRVLSPNRSEVESVQEMPNRHSNSRAKRPTSDTQSSTENRSEKGGHRESALIESRPKEKRHRTKHKESTGASAEEECNRRSRFVSAVVPSLRVRHDLAISHLDAKGHRK